MSHEPCGPTNLRAEKDAPHAFVSSAGDILCVTLRAAVRYDLPNKEGVSNNHGTDIL